MSGSTKLMSVHREAEALILRSRQVRRPAEPVSSESVWHAASCLFGFGHSDLLRLHRRRRWIGGLELAELLFFLLGLLNVSLPLFELIVWFCQFVILLQG